eukprot:CAMPEP_0170600218 /NCGR_PEP_ID=MMETSP0224-20130122/17219_1 /TAXON_ID=285029 /ORGANISM="Togula jolla, Strain CCCM 725" /LENGTH=253 /DNA_ID=CAMNT_0010924933 /DNA_START=20 /DNA_END=781 /DNA_ORIENTATION=-
MTEMRTRSDPADIFCSSAVDSAELISRLFASISTVGTCGAQGQVVLQHTFLAVPCMPEVALARRSSSAPPPPGSCNREEEALRVLTYKQRPVSFSSLGKPATASSSEAVEVAPSDSTGFPDADSEAAFEGVGFEVPKSVSSTASTPDLSHWPLGQEQAWPLPVADGSNAVAIGGDFQRGGVPRDDRGLPTSLGSLGHAQGVCKPCLFAHHPTKACSNGLACPFCHFLHPPKRRMRIFRARGGPADSAVRPRRV